MKKGMLLVAALVMSVSVYAKPTADEIYEMGCTFNGEAIKMKVEGQTEADDVVVSPEALKGGKYQLVIFANNKSHGLECVQEDDGNGGGGQDLIRLAEDIDIGCTYNGQAVKIKVEGDSEVVTSPESLKGGLIEPTILHNGQNHPIECTDSEGGNESGD